jgi:cell division septation protein DedD
VPDPFIMAQRARPHREPGRHAAVRAAPPATDQTIRHQKITIPPEQEAGGIAVRRYRPSRSWPVGALALCAAGGAMLATGALSSALEAGPEAAFSERIKRSVAGAGPGTEAHAAIPAAAAPAAAPSSAPPSSVPRPAGVWQVQVGAFRNPSAAEAYLRALQGALPELAQRTATQGRFGELNRVRIGGIEDEGTARALCDRVLATGRGCFVLRP